MNSKEQFDVFLSYASSEADWVNTLYAELGKRGVRAYQDKKELKSGQAWVKGLSDGVDASRFLVLINWAGFRRRSFLNPHPGASLG